MTTEVLGSLSFVDSPTAGGVGLVVNVNGSVPSLLADTTANRTAAGNTGRLFIDTTTLKIQRDNGTSWDTLADFITYTGTANQITVAGSVLSISSNPIVPGTGGMVLPIGTTAQRGSSTAGNIRWNSTLGNEEIYDGAAWRIPGSIAQVITANIAANTGTGTTYAQSNTAPTTAQGYSIWSASFTPLLSTSTIRIQFSLSVSHASARTVTIPVFAGSTLIGWGSVVLAAGGVATVSIDVAHAPGSTAAITYSARAIPSGSGSLLVNQTTGGSLGGTVVSSYFISEIV